VSDRATDHHLLLAFEGTALPSWFAERLRSSPVAGVTLFRPTNVAGAGQVRDLTAALQRARPDGDPLLLVAADHEGGQFLGLGADATAFAGNLALGAVGDPDLAERVGAAMGREALALGVNVVYAPDCDLLLAPGNPSIGIRSFGDDPVSVAALAAAFVRGLRAAGVAATPKHFPGVGAAPVDSHHVLGAVEAPREVLAARELEVMRAAIAADPGLVMTGHVAVPALTGRDDLPGTLSRVLVTEVLRGELGYAGVVVTDALDMHALEQGEGRTPAAVAALRAGVDLLLCAPDEEANEQLRHGLRDAWSRGELDAGQLTTSRERIAALRSQLGSAEQPPIDVVGCDEHTELAAELARRSITLVRDDVGLLPLNPDRRILVLQPSPRDLTPADTTSHVAPVMAAALRQHVAAVDELVYPDPPSDADVADAVARARRAEVVVLGTSAAHLTPSQLTLAREVLGCGRPTVLVALRTPYDVAALPAPTALCTYGIQTPTLAALAEVLVGRRDAPGRLPVALDRTPGVGAVPS
jgi:beta-N-acetylhexosaminidase